MREGRGHRGLKAVWWVAAALAVAALTAVHLHVRHVRAAAALRAARLARAAEVGIAVAPAKDGAPRRYFALPPAPSYDDRAASAGARLFPKRLLTGNVRTCASCHPLDCGGRDGRLHGAAGRTRSVCAAVLTQTNLASKVAAMLTFAQDPGAEPPSVRLRRDAGTARDLAAAFGKDWDGGHVVTALTQYVTSLLPGRTAFDLFAEGDAQALAGDARAGFDVFDRARCARCHDGPALGGWDEAPPLRGMRRRASFPEKTFGTMCDAAEIGAEDRRRLRLFLKCL